MTKRRKVPAIGEVKQEKPEAVKPARKRKRARRRAKVVTTRTQILALPQVAKNYRGDKNEIESFPRATEELRRWIENHKFLKTPFIIPREQRAYVQPHLWQFSSELINGLVGTSSKVIVQMRPSVENFLDIGIPQPEVQTETFSSNTTESQFNRVNADKFIKGMSFDEIINCRDGKRLKAGLITDAPAGYFYNSSGDAKAGLKMYPGSLNNWDGNWSTTIYNSDSSSMTVELIMLRQTAAGAIIEEPSASVNAPGHQTTTFNMIVNAADYVNITHFGFAVRILNAPTIGSIPSGLQVKQCFTNDTHVYGTIGWHRFNVWQVLNDPTGALKKQYESSNFHCFTAMHVTISNQQAELYKGGTVLAAQLAGGSEDKIPPTFEGISGWISTRQADIQESKTLVNGSHWNYRWEKVQDTFFIPVDEETNAGNKRPSYIAALQAPDVQGQDVKFNLLISGSVMLEYITEVRDAPIFMSPPDTINLLARYCSLLGEMPAVYENPSHIDTIKKYVVKLIKSPTARAIAKDLAIGAVKLALV